MPSARHHRLEALRDDLAGRLRRQHRGERRAGDAHRPARIRARTRPAARRHSPHRRRDSRNRAAAGCRARCSGRRSPDRTTASFSENSSRVGKAISDSSSIGVASCLSGGRRMVKWTRSTDGSAFSRLRHTRSPACGSPETSSTRKRSRTPDTVTTARLFCRVSSAGPGSASTSTTFSPPWPTGMSIVGVLADRHDVRADAACRRCGRRHRRCRRRAAEIVDAHAPCSPICPTMAKRAALTMVSLRSRSSRCARDQRMERRMNGELVGGRRVMHFAVGDQDRAGDALRRHIGQRRVQPGEELRAVVLAGRGRRDDALAHVEILLARQAACGSRPAPHLPARGDSRCPCSASGR